MVVGFRGWDVGSTTSSPPPTNNPLPPTTHTNHAPFQEAPEPAPARLAGGASRPRQRGGVVARRQVPRGGGGERADYRLRGGQRQAGPSTSGPRVRHRRGRVATGGQPARVGRS